MSPAWPLSAPADSLHFATVLIVLAISVDPQPPGLGRILFSECATFCYFVLAISPSLTGISAHHHLSSGFEQKWRILVRRNGKMRSGRVVHQNKERVLTQKHGRPCLCRVGRGRALRLIADQQANRSILASTAPSTREGITGGEWRVTGGGESVSRNGGDLSVGIASSVNNNNEPTKS